MVANTRRKLPLLRISACLAVSLLILIPAAGRSAEVALALQMETELGKLGPIPVDADPGRLLPVLLGITNLAHRIEATQRETARWRTANEALAQHLTAREQHLDDLRVFVARQDGAIELLEQRAQALEKLAESRTRLPVATVAVPETPAAVTQPGVANTSRLFGVALDSQYLAGALLAIIAVLLAWGLGLRSRLARSPKATSVAVPFDDALPVPSEERFHDAPSLESDHVEPSSTASEPDAVEERAPD